MKNSILIIGGAGFIGSNFVRLWRKNHPDDKIIVFDKLTYCGNLDNLHDIDYEFVQGDIVNREELLRVFQDYKPNLVINFAAETHVDRSIYFSLQEFINTNIQGVFNILDIIRRYGKVKKFIQVSTDEVYGSLDFDDNNKFTENSPFKPNVPYASTKASGDLICRSFYNTWKVPVIVTHCSNNYGEYQYPEKLIPFLTLRGLEKKSLTVHGDGKHIRDWIYVGDHNNALEFLLSEGGPGEVFNIGANNERSNIDIVKIINDFFPESQIEYLEDRLGNDRRYAIDNTKITNLGWKPEAIFKNKIIQTVNWYINNPKWINNVKKKAGDFNPSKKYENNKVI